MPISLCFVWLPVSCCSANSGSSRPRPLRGEAHRQFDKLYKHGYMSKHDAYQWLGGILGVPAQQAHIARLSLLSCDLVIREAKKQVNWYCVRKTAAPQQIQEGEVKAS